MKKFLKLRWLFLLALIYVCWRYWPMDQLPVAMPPAPQPLQEPPMELAPPPALPTRVHHPKLRHKHRPSVVATVVPEVTPSQPVLPPKAEPLATPRPQKAVSVLENVAFKSEEEVLANLGDPDEKFEHEDRESWYYSRPALSRQGKPVCPEVQFFEGQARVVIMWPPDKMSEKIATARRLKAQGNTAPKEPQTFTFMDSFKYLGVGTEQETVLEDLGEPDSKSNVAGNEEWDYDTLIVENGTSRRLAVLFKAGKVVEVQGR